MVIDALRWDFIPAMPTVTNLIENNSAYLLQARVQAPTVTLPRIKVFIQPQFNRKMKKNGNFFISTGHK